MKSKYYGILFNNNCKIYHYKSTESYEVNDEVIVEVDKGEALGKVVSILPKKANDDVKKIIRKATDEDKDTFYKNLRDSDVALKKCKEFVKELDLNMSVINAVYNLDRSQLLINFYADDRIDFRELARKLASVYHTRIELRQIGARDKAKQIDGVGICGQKLCCSRFLNQIDSISMNKAKNQNLALNPSKINGACGRLLCCLCYEDEEYTNCSKGLFPVGTIIKVDGEDAQIIGIDILSRSYKVLINEEKRTVKHEDINHGSRKK